VCLRAGVHSTADVLAEAQADPVGRHAVRATAGILVLRRRAVASEASAAYLYGLPLFAGEPAKVTLTAEPGTGSTRRYGDLSIRAARLPTSHVHRVAGVPVTTAARTVVDLARKLPFADSVALADAALQRGLAAPAQLERVLADCTGWPGIRQAARVVAFTDDRCETPLESISRVFFAGHGLPRPDTQQVIVDADGHPVGRVDFLWKQEATVGEADGQLKYRQPATLWYEKQREDRLRELGFEVVRWGWDDVLHRPKQTAHRIRAAFARSMTRRDTLQLG
jgi:Protein of unknown function (DUF559)